MILTRTIKLLVAVLIIMLPVGLFIMLSEDSWKQYLWTVNIFLGLQAAVTFIFLINVAQQKSVLIAAIAILVLAFLIEFTGLKTGFPFGEYSYTKTLVPAVLGVPAAISLSWFSVVVNSYFAARFLIDESKVYIRLFASAFIITGIDILLEPFSSFNGFWIWTSGNVPFQNYASWFVIGFIFSLLLERFVIWNRNIFLNLNFITIPAVILVINIIQFTIVDLYAGFYFSAIAGIAVISACFLLSFRYRTDEE